MEGARNPAVLQPLARFRAFWVELDGAIEDIRSNRWSSAAGSAGPDSSHAPAEAAFRRLRDAILTHGGAPPPRLAYGQTPIDLGYIMAALADETLLYLESWNGMEHWNRTLLEERIYGTRIAGERIFEEIDFQLAQQKTIQEDVGVGLMLALALGFRGKFRLLPAMEAEAETDRLRTRLYKAIFFSTPPARIDWRDTMNYPQPFQAGRLERFPRLYPWITAAAATVAFYIFLAHILWDETLGELLSTADQIARITGLGSN